MSQDEKPFNFYEYTCSASQAVLQLLRSYVQWTKLKENFTTPEHQFLH